MKSYLSIIFLILPILASGQDLEFVKQSLPPCQQELVSLYEVAQLDSVSKDEMNEAYESALEYYKADVEENCGLYTDIESNFIKDIIIKSSNDSYITYFFDYLKATKGSAGEGRSYNFEELFLKYPLRIIKLSEEESSDFRSTLVHHIAWGYLNNTYPDSKTDPIEKFWARHSKLKNPDLKNSQFVEDIIQQIKTYR